MWCVRVRVQVSVVGETVNVAGQQNSTLVHVPECRLAEDLAQLLDAGAFADVTLAVGGRELRAHKGTHTDTVALIPLLHSTPLHSFTLHIT